MAASENAIAVFEALPPAGEKISGGNLKEKTGLNSTELKAAKAELKDAGLVVLGKGRGGTVTRVEGKEVERPVKLSKKEALERARETKQRNIRIRQERDAIAERVAEVGRKAFPEAEKIEAQRLNNDTWGVVVWKDWDNGKYEGRTFGVPQEALL